LGKFGERLGDFSHMRESVLELSQLGIEPALAAAVAREMRFEKRRRVHLGAAFLAFGRPQLSFFKRNNVGVALKADVHTDLLLVVAWGYSKARARELVFVTDRLTNHII
jgi:hypothetical protein